MTPVEIQNGDGTSVRRRRRRRRNAALARRRRAAIALVLVVMGAVVLGVGFQIFHVFFPAAGVDHVDARLEESVRVEMIDAPGARTGRTVYPYSIVPGGVYGADEARRAAAHDPVVAEHYRDFVVDALHVARVERARAVHVSYRIGNEVYWTKRTLTLRPGEMLLSNGKDEVRARCGNRVSDVAQGPVSDQEPSEEALDQPAPIAVPEVLPSTGFIALADLPRLRVLFVSGEPRVTGAPDPSSFSTAMARFGPFGASDFFFPYMDYMNLGVGPLISGWGAASVNNLLKGPIPDPVDLIVAVDDPLAGGGQDVAAVPEPGTLLLVGGGFLIGAALLRRRGGLRR